MDDMDSDPEGLRTDGSRGDTMGCGIAQRYYQRFEGCRILLPYLKRWCRLLLKPLAKISGCKGAPVLPLLYIATILAFNISLLHLVKIFSAIVSSLTVMLSVPLSVYIMSKPLPYLPGGTSLSSNFMIGSIVLVLGLLLYNIPTSPTHTHTI
ncbi:hypothetical protein N665_0216s0023 [Sinapis alba]|nr:hypothetical protein N665_0216s0023 [Sinapis alba]